MVDRFGANLKAERATQRKALQGEDHWDSFVQKCEIHIVSQSNRAALDVLSKDVSGMLSNALSQQGAVLRTLQGLLGDLLTEDLDIIHSCPPGGEIARHRAQLHELFLPLDNDPDTCGPGTALTVQRRYILANMLNADLGTEQVRHYCQYQCCSSQENTIYKMRTFVAWALCPFKAPKFARSRWTNQSPCVDWHGLLASHHGLLAKLLSRWVGAPSAQPCGAAAASRDAETAGFLPDLILADATDDPGQEAADSVADAVFPVPDEADDAAVAGFLLVEVVV